MAKGEEVCQYVLIAVTLDVGSTLSKPHIVSAEPGAA